VKKHTVAIPNGRIVIKQSEKVQEGPMNMFVTSDEDKLLRFAKELSLEATESCRDRTKKEIFEAQSKRKNRKR